MARNACLEATIECWFLLVQCTLSKWLNKFAFMYLRCHSKRLSYLQSRYHVILVFKCPLVCMKVRRWMLNKHNVSTISWVYPCHSQPCAHYLTLILWLNSVYSRKCTVAVLIVGKQKRLTVTVQLQCCDTKCRTLQQWLLHFGRYFCQEVTNETICRVYISYFQRP